MQIPKQLAITILEYLHKNPDFYFPFLIVCKEYTSEDDDFIEIEPNEWKNMKNCEIYKTFELRENLKNLYEDTILLLSKGFIDKILGENSIKKYIFLTSEGFTQEPNGDEIENIQMMGIASGVNPNQAFQNLKKENDWIQESSFYEIYCHELKDQDFQYFYLEN